MNIKSKFSVLDFNQWKDVIHSSKTCRAAELEDSDFLVVELILQRSVDNYNKNKPRLNKYGMPYYRTFGIIDSKSKIDLKQYKRQYIAYHNKNGKKLVFVNCFCETYDNNWQIEFVNMMDGGECFFHVTINLSSRRYTNFNVNGNA